MRIFTLLIGILLCFFVNAQSLDSLPNFVVISELQDTMALLNNKDINIINKVFHERNILDSLNFINDSIIKELTLIKINQDNIIKQQKIIIQNDSLIKLQYQLAISNNTEIVDKLNKEIVKQKNRKIIWQSTSGGLLLTLLIILLI